jgi:hypothetical protein
MGLTEPAWEPRRPSQLALNFHLLASPLGGSSLHFTQDYNHHLSHSPLPQRKITASDCSYLSIPAWKGRPAETWSREDGAKAEK